jgi:hypothetical protein
MDKKFLNKVVDQIIRETRIDNQRDKVTYPVEMSIQVFYEPPFAYYPIYDTFIYHCEDVYGLNSEEIKYVWWKYKNTFKDIRDKIEKNLYDKLK